MAENIFELKYNQKALAPSLRQIAPGEITGQVLSKERWNPEALEAVSATLEVFSTPFADLVDLEDELRTHDGQQVGLGDIRTHAHSGEQIDFTLLPDRMYDIFCLIKRKDHASVLYGGARLFVCEEDKVPVHDGLTFEQARFLGCKALGITPEIAREQGVRATVHYLTAWGDTLPGRHIIAGFEFNGDGGQAGVTVSHIGQTSFYPDNTPRLARIAAGIS